WNPGGDIEDFGQNPLNFLRDHFSLDRVQKGSAKFDRQKLLHFNADAIARMEADTFHEKLRQTMETNVEFTEAGFIQVTDGRRHVALSDEQLVLFAEAYRPRARTLIEPAELGKFFVVDSEKLCYDWDAKPVKKILRDSEQVEKTL